MRTVFALGEDPEEVFLRHYDGLLAYALQLENDSPEQAEDLVHDAFVALSLGQISLQAALDPRGYLCGVLRHFHISRVRRASRCQTVPLSLVECDSVALAINARAGEDVSLHQELLRILELACRKKDGSKAAGVLILRFFYGFYPAEIARIILDTRHRADQWLWLARKEIARLLDDPVETGAVPAARPLRRGADNWAVLRAALASYPSGACLSRQQLQWLYGPANASPLATAVLSHLVSCTRCLEQVCRILGLGPLDDRFPTDTLGPAASGDPGSQRRRAGGAEPPAASMRRRVHDVWEHRPRELRLVVNGFPVAKHGITSGSTVLEVSGRPDETVSWVEVFSEQNMRLAFLPVASIPEGDLEQSAVVKLSDDRRVSVQVRLAEQAPEFKLEYLDPHWAPEAAVVPWPETEPVPELVPDSRAQAEPELEPASPPLTERLWRWFRPAAFALAGGLALILLLVYLGSQPTAMRAEMLLRRAGALELSLAGHKDMVLHRVFREERRRGEAVTARTVDAWVNPGSGLDARRVYDGQGRLLSGEWATPQERISIDENGSRYRERLLHRNLLDEVLHDGPSAYNLVQLAAGSSSWSLVEGDAYELEYRRPSPVQDAGIVWARLTLRRSDLRAVRETLVWRDPGGEVQEIRLVEVAFAWKPAKEVPPSVFVPGIPAKSAIPRPAAPGAIRPEILQAPELVPTAAELAAAEMEIRAALHRIGADLGEQIEIAPAASRVEVRGVLVSAERKEQVESVLAGIPYALPTLLLVDGRGSRVLPEEPAVSGGESRPVDAPLFDALKRQFPEPAAREAFVAHLLEQAQGAYDRAWALRRLAQRYHTPQLDLLTAHHRQVLSSMIRDHSDALNTSMNSLETGFRPLLAGLERQPESTANPDDGRWQADVSRLFDAVQRTYLLTARLLTSSERAENDVDLVKRSLLGALQDSRYHLTKLIDNRNATEVAEANGR